MLPYVLAKVSVSASLGDFGRLTDWQEVRADNMVIERVPAASINLRTEAHFYCRQAITHLFRKLHMLKQHGVHALLPSKKSKKHGNIVM